MSSRQALMQEIETLPDCAIADVMAYVSIVKGRVYQPDDDNLPNATRETFLGCMEGRAWIADDFDDPLDDMWDCLK